MGAVILSIISTIKKFSAEQYSFFARVFGIMILLEPTQWSHWNAFFMPCWCLSEKRPSPSKHLQMDFYFEFPLSIWLVGDWGNFTCALIRLLHLNQDIKMNCQGYTIFMFTNATYSQINQNKHIREVTHIDLIKLAEVHGLEAVDGWSDVLAVGALLHHLQLPHTRHISQPRLDLCHVRHLVK